MHEEQERKPVPIRDRRWRYQAIDIAGRSPPVSFEAESAVIADCIGDERHIALAHLAPDHFGDASCRTIWRVLRELSDEGKRIDVVTVWGRLKERGFDNAIGDGERSGLSWLSNVIDASPAIANIESHAEVVRDFSKRRRLIETCQMIAAEAYESGLSGTELADWASREIERVAGFGSALSRMETIGEIAERRKREIQAQWEGKREAWGMRTPFTKLDGITQGLKLGSFSIVGGMTSSGKSVFALQNGAFVAGRSYAFPLPNGETEIAEAGVLVISMEMPRWRYVDRHAGTLARITQHDLMTGRDEHGERLSPDRLAEIDAAFGTMSGMPMWIVDGAFNLEGVKRAVRMAQARCRILSRQRGRKVRLAMVVIDHIHIMDENDEKEVVQALSRVAKGFQRLAIDEGLHVCGLAQFNRDGPTKRGETGRPQVWDLKNGSSLEQSADQIYLIHRPVLLQQDRASEEAKKLRTKAELIAAKVRDGGHTGVVQAEFIGEHFTFVEKEAA